MFQSVSGVFSIYKPKGVNSRKAVDFVQMALSREVTGKMDGRLSRKEKLKMGHGGTLDPLAEGVLVLGVGHGCKQLANYLAGTKEYIVTAQLGSATDTFDSEGKKTQEGPTDHLHHQLIADTLATFQGNISQVPPIYSALRMNGKRLYDYARNHQALPETIQPRPVFIQEIELLEFQKDSCRFRVRCGGGTYMRSLVNDMAMAMGTSGHMTGLQRTKQGPFGIQDSLAMDSSLCLHHVMNKIKEFAI
ncbi:pseudouridine synthase [Sporodiniella umbellata]|nr:pseudouridine synthase [Sporodiniella umbellata]